MASLVGDTYRCLHTLATGNYRSQPEHYKDRSTTLRQLAIVTLKLAYAVVSFFASKALLSRIPNNNLMLTGALIVYTDLTHHLLDRDAVCAGVGAWLLMTGFQQLDFKTTGITSSLALELFKLVPGSLLLNSRRVAPPCSCPSFLKADLVVDKIAAWLNIKS